MLHIVDLYVSATILLNLTFNHKFGNPVTRHLPSAVLPLKITRFHHIIGLTMAAISSAICSNAWNIWIFDYPPCRVQAGTYQAPENPFLTWKDLFDDLLLCFDLEHYMTGQLLALYLLQSEDVLANNLNTPFIHYNPNLPGSEQILSQIINLIPLAGDEEPDLFITVHVTVIIHDIAHCEETHTDLASHLKSGTLDCHQ